MHRNLLPFISYRFKGRPVCCPVCDARESRIVSRMDRRLKPLTTAVCMECGVFYSNPMPTRDELELYYRKEYRKDYQLALLRPSKRHVAKKLREAELRHEVIREEIPEGRLSILDFGCGSGELVREFDRQGHDAHGFEPGAAYSSYAANEHGAPLNIQSATFAEAQYAPDQFDVVTMLHVLEHIPDPSAALARAHGWLKPEGLLYIEVPNMQGYDLKGFERFHFAHVLGFSRDNLIFCLRRAGFVIHRELGPTSLIARKSAAECPATINLQRTVADNLRDYTRPVSALRYARHHARRLAARLTQRLRPIEDGQR